MKNTERRPDHGIEGIILHRFSPRSMSGEGIYESELFRIFEAARWAPSAYNNQPWRLIYARRETPGWERLFDLLIDFNKQWAKNASCLVLIYSVKKIVRDGKELDVLTHSFDTGAAWQNMALQGSHMGYVVHGMQGFDYEKAATEFNLSKEEFKVEAMCAIGHPDLPEKLPESMRKMEVASGRNPQESFVRKA